MKKFILIIFIAAIAALQLKLYTIDNYTAALNFKALLLAFGSGLAAEYTGTLLIYIIPLLGVIASAISVFINKNISVVTAIISAVGILYCGYIYFVVTAQPGGSVNIGLILELVCYIIALTMSVVSIRVKE